VAIKPRIHVAHYPHRPRIHRRPGDRQFFGVRAQHEFINRVSLNHCIWKYRMKLLLAPLFALRSLSGVKSISVALLLGLTGLVAGCGGGGGDSPAASTPPAATLQSISLAPSAMSLAIAATTQFSAMGVYSDGTKKDISASVTWSSGTVTVATITATGLATAVAAGSSTITAASGSISGTTMLTVNAATLTSIGVTPAMPNSVVGLTQQFTATGVYSDSSTHDLTSTVTWSSDTPAVATISAAGLASSVAAGTATVTATLGSVSGSTLETVTAPALTSIAITPATPSIAKGLTQRLIATGTYNNNQTMDLTSSVTWSSSNLAIASLGTTNSQEIATGVSPGSVTIGASLGGIVATPVPLTVTAATVVSIQVSPATPAIANGTQQQFTAVGTYSDGSTQPITTTAVWTSSAPAVASINNNATFEGLSQALTQGTSTITATLNGVSGTATLTVNPAALVSIAITPSNPSVVNGSSVQLIATGTYTDASTQILTTTSTWTQLNSGIATVSNSAGTVGLATGAAIGTTTITATDPTTGIVSPAITITVTPTELAYVANFTDGTVSQFKVDPTGTLVSIGSAVAAGTNPYALAVDPTHNYLYVANYGSGTISEFTIATDGTLSPLATVSTGVNPNGITVSGNYVYVANFGSASVSQYTIQGNGTLLAMSPNATVAAGTGAAVVTVNQAGTFAYVPNYGVGTVSVFSIGGTGALALASTATLAAGSDPDSFAIDSTGTYAYVADLFANNIQAFTINMDGSLSTLGAPLAAGGTPRSITVSGSNLYLPNSGANQVWQFTSGAGGALTLAGTTTLGVGTSPNFMAIDASGQYAYVTDRGVSPSFATTVSQFSVGANGALTPMSTPTVTVGTQPTGILTTTAHP